MSGGVQNPSYGFELPKSVLVSGATGAIGAALCESLSRRGVRIIAVAKSGYKLAKLVEGLESKSAMQHQFIRVDFSSRESVVEFGQHLNEKGLEVDGVVLNPPRISPRGDLFPCRDDWDSVFQDVFFGPLQLLEFAVDKLRVSTSSIKRIAILSGISSKQVLSHYSMNNAVRSAWAAQAKTLAFALGPEKIHVNTLSIGGVLTPAYQSRIEQKAEKAGVTIDHQMAMETSNVPLGKYASVDETVNALVGLLSGFTDHMTGVNFPFEGGYFPHY